MAVAYMILLLWHIVNFISSDAFEFGCKQWLNSTKGLFSTNGMLTYAPHPLPKPTTRGPCGKPFVDYYREKSLKLACLDNTFIFMIGDSVDGRLFYHTCDDTLDGVVQVNRPLPGYKICKTARNITLVLTLICGNHEGPYLPHCYNRFSADWNSKERTVWNHTLSTHVENMKIDLVAAMGGKRPDLITLNFGLWDMASKWYFGTSETRNLEVDWFKGYPEEFLESSVKAIKMIKRAFPEALTVFRSIGRVYPERFKNDRILQDRLHPKYIAQIYLASRYIANKVDEENFAFLDFYEMYTDHHCTMDGVHLYEDHMSVGYLNLVLNSICNNNKTKLA